MPPYSLSAALVAQDDLILPPPLQEALADGRVRGLRWSVDMVRDAPPSAYTLTDTPHGPHWAPLGNRPDIRALLGPNTWPFSPDHPWSHNPRALLRMLGPRHTHRFSQDRLALTLVPAGAWIGIDSPEFVAQDLLRPLLDALRAGTPHAEWPAFDAAFLGTFLLPLAPTPSHHARLQAQAHLGPLWEAWSACGRPRLTWGSQIPIAPPTAAQLHALLTP